MAMKGGNPANLKGGSRKGIPNKLSRIAKENIEQVFEELGGVEAMVKWARARPDVFYGQVYPKLLPLQVTGANGGPVVMTWRLEPHGEAPDAGG